ncbi:MAG: alpha-mannosidase [Acidobacteria bacterium]|nr:MAG: alpha-mannosidase [Acidobacteriota bacterium]
MVSGSSQTRHSRRSDATRARNTSEKSKPKVAAANALRPDLSKDPTLYVVGYAHLDTEWRWEYPQVIQEYLTKTMRNNFALFEKYPHYIFNFTGANRYRLMKEYYPSDFERLKHYVANGRWFPAGSSMEEGDVNSPNAESIIRQILYGNNWFRKEFGIASDEYMLPDCFGFPASLPSILAHSGIKGFSTQKLSSAWQPAPHVGGRGSLENTPVGIPFNVGLWEGPDGRTVMAALNPMSYGSQVNYDITKSPPPPPGPDPIRTAQLSQVRNRSQEDWPKRIATNGNLTGIFADYHYVGTGDVGGSPNESSVKLMEAIITKSKSSLPPFFPFGVQPRAPTAPVPVGDGPIHVTWSKADQIFKDILNCCSTDRLPRYKGDLELINHSAGSLTSEAYQKRWMRKNELLADAAEKASVAAEWLGARAYPRERLNDAWTLVMGGQFHDLLPGTATPKAFEFAWNDDVLAMNQFAGVLTSAANGVAAGLDTEAKGIAIVVYNPLNVQREDVVEANIQFPNGPPAAVRIVDPKGVEVPAQMSHGKVLFLAKVPSVGFAVYDVQPASSLQSPSELKVTELSLENARYRLAIDSHGDVSHIFDKQLNRELLSAPIRLAISTDNPRRWPAWNMDFEDEQRAPRSFVSGSAKVRVVETGPVRVAIEVERETEGSKFVQRISLSTGDAGNRVEFSNVINWKTKEANLKATFPLSAANNLATYNWDVGTVQRSNEEERQFEVASHQWIDLTDKSGSFGVTILTDCKNASDKLDDKTIRLTLIRTPGTRGGYADQGTQDIGRHEIIFGLAGHANDWRQSQTDWQAYRLNQPLTAFQSPSHAGALGKTFSLLKLNNDRIRVMALKKAELSDETIVRLVEMDGKREANVHISFPSVIIAAREVNGQEQPLSPANVSNGELTTSFDAYQPRTFAIKLAPSRIRIPQINSQPVPLDYEMSVAARMGRPADGAFDWAPNSQGASQGKALPAEMLPRQITFGGIRFDLAPAGKPNAIIAHGQTINLPTGNFNRVYLLAAAANGDQKATFRVGSKATDLTIQEWTGFIGQWGDRIWRTIEEPIPIRPNAPPGTPVRTRPNIYGEMIGLRPGFIKRADVAWFSSQRRAADGSAEPYAYSYLFAYAIDLAPGARTLTLPDSERVRILAVTVANEPWILSLVHPLYDTLERE